MKALFLWMFCKPVLEGIGLTFNLYFTKVIMSILKIGISKNLFNFTSLYRKNHCSIEKTKNINHRNKMCSYSLQAVA